MTMKSVRACCLVMVTPPEHVSQIMPAGVRTSERNSHDPDLPHQLVPGDMASLIILASEVESMAATAAGQSCCQYGESCCMHELA